MTTKPWLRFGKDLAIWATLAVAANLLASHALAQGAPPGYSGPAAGAGANAVYSGTTNSSIVGSPAFIDVSGFGNPLSGDVCVAIGMGLADLAQNYSRQGVVDARGVPKLGGVYICTVNPFANNYGVTSGLWPPRATVLLPAGTISVISTWYLGQSTKLVGLGPGQTVLQASLASGDMIDMGKYDSNYCTTMNTFTNCTGITIEHLTVDGASVSGVNGIVNNFAEELSYVEDVAFTNIYGVALSIGPDTSGHGTAANSGPYSNISVVTNGQTSQCLKMTGSFSGTRGIRGLTCTSSSASPSIAAITVDSSNNSFRDIIISGFNDGIVIGANATARNNLLMNVSGSVTSGALIHISGTTNSSSTCPHVGVATAPNACDITLLGLSGAASHKTIQDDLTSMSMTDLNLAMYVLGEQVFYGSSSPAAGYSLFTTSLSGPSWYSGTKAPMGVTCPKGSLYSCTKTGNCTNTLWGCKGTGGWTPITTTF